MLVAPHDSGEKPTITKELNCKRGGKKKNRVYFIFILRDADPALDRPELQQVLLYSPEAAANPGLYPG